LPIFEEKTLKTGQEWSKQIKILAESVMALPERKQY